MDRVLVILFGVLFVALPGRLAWSEGYLATDLQKLPDLVFGVDQAGFAVSTPNYQLTTGKAYQLTIISSGKREYAIHADDFFNFIWLRKIEVGDVEIKTNGLYEIEMEREGKATLFFVPIKPGKYRIYAKGLDAKGAVASIEVK
ncbi:MAG TPA: copper-binding protein [Hyphomicrobiaceae bacterium]|nr:copper-binding protein [Hyphomicrobiaceae bacterium]